MNRSQTQSSHLPVSSDTIRRMVEHLILNSSFTSDLGLFHGKMGTVIFFAHYARWTGNALYEDFADELLGEIYEDIHTDTPINLESGLCGIGWGIEYLVQNGFMEGDTDEILEDIDRRIMERDPRRMTDLSFRTGLGGILFYATARLTASRESDGQPFDSLYLNDLKEAAQRATFTEQDEIPSCLFKNFLSALHGDPLPAPSLPALLFTDLPQTDKYLTLPVGLEKGITGILVDIFVTQEAQQSTHSLLPNNSKEVPSDTRKSLYIINQESRAATYGIGTYIRQLIAAMRDTDWKITVVHLSSYKSKEITLENEESVSHIRIPMPSLGVVGEFQSDNPKYSRNMAYLLRGYIKEESPIFHFQFMKLVNLAKILKEYFPASKNILTVHYTDWSFSLLGNREKLRKALLNPEDQSEQDTKTSVENEKKMLQLCSDGIIAIAKHSYNMLLEDYGVPMAQLQLIPNGLEDKYKSLTVTSRDKLRKQWGFQPKEVVLLFAGRIDEVKGITVLGEVFVRLRKKYRQIRLVVAGDGSFQSIMSSVLPYAKDVTFTGLIPQEQLFQLFSIADIGILPSLHEEFGYVALEMMMMGLPLIVGQTTGLAELVVNGETGITIPVDDKEKMSDELVTAISSMIDDALLRRNYGISGRKRYLANFESKIFAANINRFLTNCFSSNLNGQ